MKRTGQVLACVSLIAVLCTLPGAAIGQAGSAPAANKIQIDGSTTVGPIAVEFAAAFQKLYPNVTITVTQTGSGNGIKSLIDGRCQIATSSRAMKLEEYKAAVEKGITPVTHVIAMDGVCAIVHPSNPVKALKTEQLHDIYAGKITNWNQVGGPDKPIHLVSRETDSGTYECFTLFVMGKDKMAEGTEYVNSNPQMHERVASTEGAIGFVGLGFLDNKVKGLEINGVMPTAKTIQSGQYPYSRPLYLYTNGYPDLGSVVHAFCTHYLTDKGQEIIKDKGFVPVTNY